MSGDLISREVLLKEYEWLKTVVNPCSVAEIEEHMERIRNAPAVNAVDRDKVLKRMYPMGIPRSRYEWDYSINARAVYEAIMKD